MCTLQTFRGIRILKKMFFCSEIVALNSPLNFNVNPKYPSTYLFDILRKHLFFDIKHVEQCHIHTWGITKSSVTWEILNSVQEVILFLDRR